MKPLRTPPATGQESVWDYPRPPIMQASAKHIQVIINGMVLADTHWAYRVLETGHPPVYYVPPQDIRMEYLQMTARQTFCEYKGAARYYSVTAGDRTVENAAWCYPHPARGYEALTNYVAFYPQRMDACFVDGEQVTPQPGDFYGGWITREIAGPFKGDVGTLHW